MKSERLNTTLVGIALIMATVFGVMAAVVENPILSTTDYLIKISTNPSAIIIGAFLTTLMAICCAGVGMALYPLMKKYSVFLAIAIVGFRLAEAVFQIIIGASQVSLIPLGQAVSSAEPLELAAIQTIASTIKVGSDWLNTGAMTFCWRIAALMYYSIFYQNKLVPRWLSAWGLIGIMLSLGFSVAVTLNLIPANSDREMLFSLPIFIQELVFASWLIIKGLKLDSKVYRAGAPQFSASQQVEI